MFEKMIHVAIAEHDEMFLFIYLYTEALSGLSKRELNQTGNCYNSLNLHTRLSKVFKTLLITVIVQFKIKSKIYTRTCTTEKFHF